MATESLSGILKNTGFVITIANTDNYLTPAPTQDNSAGSNRCTETVALTETSGKVLKETWTESGTTTGYEGGTYTGTTPSDIPANTAYIIQYNIADGVEKKAKVQYWRYVNGADNNTILNTLYLSIGTNITSSYNYPSDQAPSGYVFASWSVERGTSNLVLVTDACWESTADDIIVNVYPTFNTEQTYSIEVTYGTGVSGVTIATQ